MQLAGVPIRDDDVRELERLLREGGYVDVAGKLDHALTMEMPSRNYGACCSQSTSVVCARGSSSPP